MNKEQPVTLTLGEIDSTLFETLTSEFKSMYPNDHRTALRAAMHVADKVMGQIEPLAAKQAKRAAASRLSAPPMNPGAEPTPQAFQTPSAPYSGPVAAPVKRQRRSRAQMEADRAAVAAAQAVPMGPAFSPPFQPAPPAAAPMLQPPPAPTNSELTSQAFPAAPPVQDFATLARQAAAQGVPQFAPANVPPPTFG